MAYNEADFLVVNIPAMVEELMFYSPLRLPCRHLKLNMLYQ